MAWKTARTISTVQNFFLFNRPIMKTLVAIVALAFIGCSNVAESISLASVCEFDFHKLSQCRHGDYQVSIQTSPLADDEIQLKTLLLNYKGKQYSLEITADTSLLDGDRGIIAFDDINFDGIADIAISTSFGLANQYMDYWVYDAAKKRFNKIGNHAHFSLNPADKTLSNTVKIDAANYQKNIYSWQDGKLVKKLSKPGN